MRDYDDPLNEGKKPGEKPENLLQDYLDGLLGLNDSDASFQQASQPVSTHMASPQEIPFQNHQAIDRVVGDREPVSRPATVPVNNVLPLPRFAEVRPLALKLPLPKLKPVSPVTETKPKTVDVKPVEIKVPVEVKTVEPLPVEIIVEEQQLANTEDIEVEQYTAVEDDIEENSRQTFVPREWLANGRPEWAQGRFECLMFTVGGLSLAVPLIELGNISPLTDELTPLFGQIDWFMGLLPTRTGKLRTVDTAKIVMPERYREDCREKYRFVISIAGMDWGLAVDDVSTAISLSPDDVKWRSQRSKRPWLAGTLVAQMCAVLDIQQLAFLLFQAEQQRPRAR